jgi:hypothetical protein
MCAYTQHGHHPSCHGWIRNECFFFSYHTSRALPYEEKHALSQSPICFPSISMEHMKNCLSRSPDGNFSDTKLSIIGEKRPSNVFSFGSKAMESNLRKSNSSPVLPFFAVRKALARGFQFVEDARLPLDDDFEGGTKVPDCVITMNGLTGTLLTTRRVMEKLLLCNFDTNGMWICTRTLYFHVLYILSGITSEYGLCALFMFLTPKETEISGRSLFFCDQNHPSRMTLSD